MTTDWIILVVAAVVLIFLVTRIFWLWYFQIQERTTLMREQNEILKAIFKQLGGSIDQPVNKSRYEN